MTTSLRKGDTEEINILKEINVEGEVHEGQEVIVRYETCALKWKGFESQMAIWTKIYERF